MSRAPAIRCEVRYRPLAAADEDAAELSLPEGIVEAVRELSRARSSRSGDILVFLPGEKHIREATLALQRARLPRLEVMPLFARLTAQQQERIFEPHTDRRVILATNVAETSLTVPQVRHVIDSGLARISRYSVRSKVQRLPLEPVSKASANQRRGRCGREAPGHLHPAVFGGGLRGPRGVHAAGDSAYASGQRAAAHGRLGAGRSRRTFPFLDPPDTRQINDGVRQLQELGAMDDAAPHHRRSGGASHPCPAIRNSAGCCWPPRDCTVCPRCSSLPHFSPCRTRASAQRMRRRRRTRHTRAMRIRARIS